MADDNSRKEIESLLRSLSGEIDAMRLLNENDRIEPAFREQMLITLFRELSEHASRSATHLAFHVIDKYGVTKRSAADRLRVHPHTLDRAMTRYWEETGNKMHPLQYVISDIFEEAIAHVIDTEK